MEKIESKGYYFKMYFKEEGTRKSKEKVHG